MVSKALTAVLLAACSSPAPAPVSPVTPTPIDGGAPTVDAALALVVAPQPVPPPPPPCITEPGLDAIHVSTTDVVLCGGEDAQRACWRVDLATKTVAPAPVAAPLPIAVPPPRVQRLPDGRVEVCPTAGTCTTITPGAKIAEDDALDLDPTGALLVRADVKAFEVYNLAPWKRRMRLTRTPAAMEYGRFDWVFHGDRVLVFEAVSPVSSRARIVTLDGKVLGTVGDKAFSQQPHDHWLVDGTTYAFKDIDGVRLVVADLATGKTLATHKLDAMLVKADDHPMIEAAGFAADAKVLVVAGSNGVVGVIERATGKLSTVAIPRCAAGTP